LSRWSFCILYRSLGTLSTEESSQDVEQEYNWNYYRYTHSVSYITRLAFDNGFLPKEMAATKYA